MEENVVCFIINIMVQIRSKDFYEIRQKSIISDLDDRFLVLLYQPFIGVEATALYLTLKVHEAMQTFGDLQPIDHLLTLTDLNLTQLHHARSRLEAVGLLQTHRQKLGEQASFSFLLYAPKSVAEFFADPLLSGMLAIQIGEKATQQIKDVYLQPIEEKTTENVSASFGEVFHPNLDNPLFATASTSGLLGRKTSSIRKPFDQVSFLEHLRQMDVPVTVFEPHMKTLIDYATLYGLDELALSELLLAPHVTNLMTGDIQFEELGRLASLEKRLPFVRQRQQKKLLKTTSDRTVDINEMETLSPYEFLQKKQHGATPSAPDLKLVSELYFSMHLPYPVINALIDHVLRTHENTLPKSITLKIAASLGREHLEHAIDTLDYIAKVENQWKKSYKSTPKPTTTPPKSQDTPIDDAELEARLKALK